MNKKLISLLLSFWLVVYSLMPYGIMASVYAQEESPTSSPVEQQTVTETSSPESSASSEASPSESPIESASPTESPVSSSEPEVSASPTASPAVSPTPTPIPYWSDEYDALDDAMEAREDEWEAHEEDEAWIAAHGGSEYYYTSGAWQRDEDARIAAEQAAAAAEAARIAEEQAAAAAAAASSDPLSSDPALISGLTEDGTSQLNPCSTDGSVDSLALAAGSESIDVSNNNCLVLDDTTTASGTSGENSQTFVDGPVNTTTGSSSGDGSVVNTGNINTTDTSGAGSNAVVVDSDDAVSSDSSGETLTQGEGTDEVSSGQDLTNGVLEGADSEVLGVSNTNEAYVNNQLNVSGTSGENIQVGNDGEATLTTGDIELIANMLNILNLNITGEEFMHLIINIFGTLNGDLDIDDIASALGLSSDEELEVIAQGGTSEESSSKTTDINNDNSAVVNNEMNVSGVSGANNVSGNDGDVDVVTGRIKILANLMNFINANFSGEKWSFIMINIFGKLVGDIIVPDTAQYTDGAGSVMASGTDGSVQSTSEDTTSITNTNGVTLNNNMDVNGISGENAQLCNDDGDATKTGEVDVVTRLMNFLNFNITGNNWVFLVVNVFGKWMGKIVNFAGSDINAPTDGSFAALSVGSTGSVGEGTSTTNIDNDNKAVVNNTMNVDGISGQNTVNKNDGATSLTTGWVEIDANLLNIINMNVAGRSWMIVFLNIFGDFFGDLFFGPKPAPVMASAESAQTGGSDVNYSVSSTSVSSTSEVSASSSGGGSAAAVVTTKITTNGKRRIIRRVVATSGPQVLSFTSNGSNEQSEQPYSYFIIFGKRVRIPSILLKLFSNSALRKYLSFAHR